MDLFQDGEVRKVPKLLSALSQIAGTLLTSEQNRPQMWYVVGVERFSGLVGATGILNRMGYTEDYCDDNRYLTCFFLFYS